NPLQTENASPNGTAIVGWARSSGSNLGVYGLANGATGTGVFGLAKSESSVVNYGGRFESRSSVGRGVYAIASDSGSSQSFGGWFQSNSSKGRGIQGFVSSATGKTYGGIFQSNSDEGYGLYAYTSSDSGSPYALYAKTNSATGYAGFFVGGRSYFQNNVGIGIINPSVPLHTTGNVTFASGWRLVETAGVSNIVGGYTLNVIENGLQGAVISGGGSELQPNTIVTDGSWATIGGGAGNTASSDSATIAGGFLNTASGSHGTVAGGYTNTASGTYSFTGGGYTNTASGSYATAGGGYGNTATQMYTTVGGGISNAASSAFCAISGGYLNQATAAAATVGGGQQNTASSSYATVSGGIGNSATNEEATVAGGYMNAATGAYATASGGSGNLSSGSASSVLGGSNGVASGSYSVACGGLSNEAIDFGAFAAGYRAKANHSGAFVWGDTSVAADVTSSRTYEWTIRSTGGVRFYTSTDLSTGVTLAAGGSGWAAVCDRNQKENFERLDTRDVLNKVCAIPMTTWNYKTQDDAIRHMGPMAQDFWHAFELGADELRINTIDADGVALAAIQGLNEIVKEQDAEIKDLKQRLARLEAVVAALAAADSE
ncbi:MAG: hypothetical protein D8M59_13760, partial [Planctomycetes bacterium]|nr:hypothetical protein [Planctomycetota bacterium]